jgi:hypothetical protein
MNAVYTLDGVDKSAAMDAVSYVPSSRNAFSASLIEEAFRAMLITGGVSSNVFSNRPKSLSPTVQDFVVASLQGTLEDMKAYGDCTVNVTLFSKDAAGFKNAKKLSILQDRVMASVPMWADVVDGQDKVMSFEVGDTPDIIGDAPDDYGFHARMILFQVTIKLS